MMGFLRLPVTLQEKIDQCRDKPSLEAWRDLASALVTELELRSEWYEERVKTNQARIDALCQEVRQIKSDLGGNHG